MIRVSSEMRSFAERLIVCEANGNETANAKPPDGFYVCEKLRPQLAKLMGIGCFRALFMRALLLASVEVSCLRATHVKMDGALGGLEEFDTARSPDELCEGGVVLLARFLGLLVAFVGEYLTLQLIREVWPQASLDDLNLVNGANHEKTQ